MSKRSLLLIIALLVLLCFGMVYFAMLVKQGV